MESSDSASRKKPILTIDVDAVVLSSQSGSAVDDDDDDDDDDI